MAIRIAVDAKPLATVLSALRAAMLGYDAPFNDIGGHLLLTTYDRFSREVAPDGTRWAPNSESTLLNYMRKRTGGRHLSAGRTRTGGRTVTQKGMVALGSKKILRNTGTLQDMMTYQIVGNKLIFGPSVQTKKYAAAMQFGIPRGYIPSKPNLVIPARPYIGVTPNDLLYIKSAFQRHFFNATVLS